MNHIKLYLLETYPILSKSEVNRILKRFHAAYPELTKWLNIISSQMSERKTTKQKHNKTK